MLSVLSVLCVGFWELSVLFCFFFVLYCICVVSLFILFLKSLVLIGRWFFFAIAWNILVENLDTEREKIVGFVLFSVIIHCVVG